MTPTSILGRCARGLRRAAAPLRDEDGITGLETAIILIAFVVVAAVFAFVVLSTGLFSSERSKEAVYAGIAKTRGTMVLSSGMVGTANAGLTQLDTVDFDLSLAAGGDAVNLDPAATSNSTVISYIDATTVINDVPFTTTVVSGNTNNLLEPGELIRISIDLTGAGATIPGNATFTIEVKPPTGSFMVIQRTTPAAFQPINLLR
jgi:flagellin FlaB